MIKFGSRVASKAFKKTTTKVIRNAADTVPSHASHTHVTPHTDAPHHADLDNIATHHKPEVIEVPVHPDKVPGRIEALGNYSKSLAGAGVIGYGGYEAVQAMQKTRDEVSRGGAAVVDGIGNVAQKTADAALAAANKAAELAAHAAEGPEAAYQAMLAQLHELEAGAKRVTGSGSLSTAIAVVSVTGSAYMALQFYRAYKS